MPMQRAKRQAPWHKHPPMSSGIRIRCYEVRRDPDSDFSTVLLKYTAKQGFRCPDCDMPRLYLFVGVEHDGNGHCGKDCCFWECSHCGAVISRDEYALRGSDDDGQVPQASG